MMFMLSVKTVGKRENYQILNELQSYILQRGVINDLAATFRFQRITSSRILKHAVLTSYSTSSKLSYKEMTCTFPIYVPILVISDDLKLKLTCIV